MNPFLLVLCVIQNADTRSRIKKALQSAGHRVIEAGSCAQAQLLIANGLEPDMLLADDMPAARVAPESQEDLFRRFPQNRTWFVTGSNDFPHGGITATNSNRHSISADDIGAVVAELARRQTDPDEAARVQSTAERGRSSVPPYIEELGNGSFFLAASPKMLDVYRQVTLLADTDVNVLVLGESGVGKEIVARLIHKTSQRRDRRFLKVNCAALPADLLESELFGYKQGAFTGAVKDLPGKFEQADRGTLFLDEIGEIGVQLQAKLLHVLEDGQFSRLGAQQSTKIDVRVIAATNVQMENALLQGRFRDDLYYRLSVFTITVPPLRERREEISYLIEEMIRRTPIDMKGENSITIPTRFMDAALRYDWPGNLRELRNVVTRAIIMRDTDAGLRQLEEKVGPAKACGARTGASQDCSNGTGMKSVVRDLKERAEAKMIQDALEDSGWNRRHAAQSLNISYRALLYKIQQHRLAPQKLEYPHRNVRSR